MKSRHKPNNLIMDMRPVGTSTRKLSKSHSNKFLKNRRLVFSLVALVALVAIGLLSTHASRSVGQKELSQVKATVEKLMLLPNDEEPTLAIVDDVSKLKDSFLIAKAQNGDDVLLYNKNAMVIIYRPSINKIVAVGSVTADPAIPEAHGASITVMNGSNDSVKTKIIMNKVREAYPDLKIIDGGSTNKQDFTTTIVIDNTNQKDNLQLALMSVVNGKKGVVPLGEIKSETDLMIIVGKD
jgi:hypothetical protein